MTYCSVSQLVKTQGFIASRDFNSAILALKPLETQVTSHNHAQLNSTWSTRRFAIVFTCTSVTLRFHYNAPQLVSCILITHQCVVDSTTGTELVFWRCSLCCGKTSRCLAVSLTRNFSVAITQRPALHSTRWVNTSRLVQKNYASGACASQSII